MQVSAPKYRFGSFELDCTSGELRKHGSRIHLEDQPLRLLCALVQRHGEIVDRDTLKSELWAEDTYVDFDPSLTRAINKVRTALGDSAAKPMFLETLPRRGYRFVAPVSIVNGEPDVPAQPSAKPRNRYRTIATLSGVAVILALGAGYASRHSSSVPIASIAVLPFDGISTGQNYFGDGMTDQLISALSRHRSLRVVSHKSVVQYRNTRKKLSEIANDLKVDALVDGSVTQAGERIRVNARLIRFPEERTAWTRSFERNMSGILTLQAELARSIAGEIGIAAASKDPIPEQPVDPVLHAQYLKGRFFANEPQRASMELGIQTLEQVVQKDPGFAPAYAAMAHGWYALSSNFLAPKEAMPKAKAAARKAIELDPNNDAARAVLGHVHYRYDWDWAAAQQQFDKALDINPNSAESYRGLALLRLATGQQQASIDAGNRAVDLAPMSFWANITSTLVLLFNRREDEAIRRAGAALEWEPEFAPIRAFLGMTYLDRGQQGDAIRELERAVKSLPVPLTQSFLVMGYARAGRTQEAQTLLDKLVALAARRYVCPFEIAAAFVSLGKKEEALVWLRRAIDERADCVIFLRCEPWLAPLRSDPRYAALLKEVGFPADAPPASHAPPAAAR